MANGACIRTLKSRCYRPYSDRPAHLPVLRFAHSGLCLLCVLLLAGCSHAVKVPLLGTAKVPLLGAIDNAPAPSLDAAVKQLKDATPCCNSFAAMPYNDALPAEPRAFTLDRFSPVAELDGERTHFLTFVLPPYHKPYRIVFQAQPSARHLGNSFLLAPTVTLLDADHKPLSSTDVPLCVYINWRPSMSGGFGAITVDNAAARFLVVTTSKVQLAATTYWAQSPTSFSDVNVPSTSTMAGIKSAAPANSGSFKVKHGPTGTLYLGRMTPAYASAVAKGMCGKPAKGAGLLPELRHTFQNL